MRAAYLEIEWSLLLRSLDDLLDYLKNPDGKFMSLPLLPSRLEKMLDQASEKECEDAEQEFLKKLVEKDPSAWIEFLCVLQKNRTADQRYREFMGLSPFQNAIIVPVKKDLENGVAIDTKGLELAITDLLARQFRNADFTGTVVLLTKGFVIK